MLKQDGLTGDMNEGMVRLALILHQLHFGNHHVFLSFHIV
jgi:hypothetical protein